MSATISRIAIDSTPRDALPVIDPTVTVWNPESATHKRSARRMAFAPGLGLTQPDDTCFRNGVPFETIYPDYQKTGGNQG